MQVRHKNQEHDLLSKISPFIIGSVAGMIEVVCNHPMWVLKTVIQTKNNTAASPQTSLGLKSLFNPRLIYSGVLANALSMIPATGLRIGMNQTLRSTFSADPDNPTVIENLIFMSMAGISASFVCAPVDLVNTIKYKLKRQAILFPEQKIGTTFIAASAYLIKQQNGVQCLAYGLPATMLREATYTPFFLGMTPYVKLKVRHYVNNDTQATIASGVVTGITSSAITQPLDTIKTRQQDIQLNQVAKPSNWLSTAGKIYQEGGLSRFFAGGSWRMARIASAISIMTIVTDNLNNKFQK